MKAQVKNYNNGNSNTIIKIGGSFFIFDSRKQKRTCRHTIEQPAEKTFLKNTGQCLKCDNISRIDEPLYNSKPQDYQDRILKSSEVLLRETQNFEWLRSRETAERLLRAIPGYEGLEEKWVNISSNEHFYLSPYIVNQFVFDEASSLQEKWKIWQFETSNDSFYGPKSILVEEDELTEPDFYKTFTKLKNFEKGLPSVFIGNFKDYIMKYLIAHTQACLNFRDMVDIELAGGQLKNFEPQKLLNRLPEFLSEELSKRTRINGRQMFTERQRVVQKSNRDIKKIPSSNIEIDPEQRSQMIGKDFILSDAIIKIISSDQDEEEEEDDQILDSINIQTIPRKSLIKERLISESDRITFFSRANRRKFIESENPVSKLDLTSLWLDTTVYVTKLLQLFDDVIWSNRGNIKMGFQTNYSTTFLMGLKLMQNSSNPLKDCLIHQRRLESNNRKYPLDRPSSVVKPIVFRETAPTDDIIVKPHATLFELLYESVQHMISYNIENQPETGIIGFFEMIMDIGPQLYILNQAVRDVNFGQNFNGSMSQIVSQIGSIYVKPDYNLRELEGGSDKIINYSKRLNRPQDFAQLNQFEAMNNRTIYMKKRSYITLEYMKKLDSMRFDMSSIGEYKDLMESIYCLMVNYMWFIDQDWQTFFSDMNYNYGLTDQKTEDLEEEVLLDDLKNDVELKSQIDSLFDETKKNSIKIVVIYSFLRRSPYTCKQEINWELLSTYFQIGSESTELEELIKKMKLEK